jgi:hypothetical protein
MRGISKAKGGPLGHQRQRPQAIVISRLFRHACESAIGRMPGVRGGENDVDPAKQEVRDELKSLLVLIHAEIVDSLQVLCNPQLRGVLPLLQILPDVLCHGGRRQDIATEEGLIFLAQYQTWRISSPVRGLRGAHASPARSSHRLPGCGCAGERRPSQD